MAINIIDELFTLLDGASEVVRGILMEFNSANNGLLEVMNNNIPHDFSGELMGGGGVLRVDVEGSPIEYILFIMTM